jgi:hypothetical protein
MKQKTSSSTGSKKVALVIIAATIGFLILTPIILVRQAERQRMRIYQIDPGTLLVACRTLIAEKAGYRHDDSTLAVRTDPGTVVLDPSVAPLQTNIPSVIRDLNPKLIVIGSNKVTVCLWTLPKRYLFGFAEGASEYGSEKITNGLWLWYGN